MLPPGVRETPALPGVTDVAALVAAAAREVPDRLALVEAEGRSLTWAGLDDEVARVAAGLLEAGVVAGHRVALVLGNRIELVTAYLALTRLQAVAVPVNPRVTERELAHVVADAGARLVFCDPGSAAVVRAGLSPATDTARPPVTPRVVVVGGAGGTGDTGHPGEEATTGELAYDDLLAAAPRPLPALTDPDRLAVLLYTSGTSGRPRAAMLSHRALVANLRQALAVEPPMVTGDDVVLGLLPLFHVYGLNAVLGLALAQRARLVLVDRFDPAAVLDLVDDEAVSVLPVVPTVLASWLDEPHLRERLGPVRLVLSGSAPLPPDLRAAFTTVGGLEVHQGYGLTETAPVLTSTLAAGTAPAGSVGVPLPGVDLRVVDEGGRASEPGDAGEIWVRGENLFDGYWPDGADGPDDEGWWPTGDVGYLDTVDGVEHLFLVDRVKELVIVSGFNVYPAEVEDVLREVEGVRDAAVVGVPDPTTGEAVVAYVRAPGRDPGAVVAEVHDHAARRLARFKRPARVEVVGRLPLTVTGKVRRASLREAARGAGHGGERS